GSPKSSTEEGRSGPRRPPGATGVPPSQRKRTLSFRAPWRSLSRSVAVSGPLQPYRGRGTQRWKGSQTEQASHVTGSPPKQKPELQRSPPVQGLPSSQALPSGSLEPTHSPSTHASPAVQGFASSHGPGRFTRSQTPAPSQVE